MDFETPDMDIMINYLHRRKGIECELHMNEYDIDADGIDWSDKGDDPTAYRKDYDRDLALFLDGYRDGDDLMKKDGFHDLFVRGKVSAKADDDGFRRFDALFRGTKLYFSVYPNGRTKLILGNYRNALLPNATDMRVLEALYVEEDPVAGPHLNLKIRGSVWAPTGGNRE